jgi:alpha-tubulin suppressor-like RCC1 family protein
MSAGWVWRGLAPIANTWRHRLGVVPRRNLTSFREHVQLLKNANRKVLAWGAGGDFQLATSHPHEATPAPMEIEALNGVEVVYVSAGWVTSYALTASGDVLGWGSNQMYALPTESQSASHHQTPSLMRLLHPKTQQPLRIKKVQAGRAHTVFLDDHGAVYSVGMADLGQLGHDQHGDKVFSAIPVQVAGELTDRVIVDIATGLDHNLALSSDGHVYSWGFAADGQLGIGDLDEENEVMASPRRIGYQDSGARLPPIAQIAAGTDSTGLLTASGEVFMCGSNVCKQLGVGPDVDSVREPVPLGGALKGLRIVELSLGGTHGLARTGDHRVFVWGWNAEGRLGMPKDVEECVYPVENPRLSKLRLKMMAAGGGHTIVVDEDDRFYAFGFGACGRLGLGAQNRDGNVFDPTPIKLLNPPRTFSRVISLSAGFDHNLLVVE